MTELKKDNVILKESDKSRIKELKAQGFKELDEHGNVIEEQSEKTVPFTDYEKLQREFEELKKENTSLKGQITKLKNELKDKK